MTYHGGANHSRWFSVISLSQPLLSLFSWVWFIAMLNVSDIQSGYISQTIWETANRKKWWTFWLSYSKWTNQIPPLSVEPVGESATLNVGFFLLSRLINCWLFSDQLKMKQIGVFCCFYFWAGYVIPNLKSQQLPSKVWPSHLFDLWSSDGGGGREKTLDRGARSACCFLLAGWWAAIRPRLLAGPGCGGDCRVAVGGPSAT